MPSRAAGCRGRGDCRRSLNQPTQKVAIIDGGSSRATQIAIETGIRIVPTILIAVVCRYYTFAGLLHTTEPRREEAIRIPSKCHDKTSREDNKGLVSRNASASIGVIFGHRTVQLLGPLHMCKFCFADSRG